MGLKKHISLIVSYIALSIVIILYIYIEQEHSAGHLYDIRKSEALTLIGTINHSIENTITAGEAFEQKILNTLRISGGLLAEWPMDILPDCPDSEADMIVTMSKSGKLSWHKGEDNYQLEPGNIRRALNQADISGNMYIPGLIEAGSSYLYTVAFRTANGDYLLLGIDEKRLLELRRSFGIGKLIREMGSRSDIVYLLLQDTMGIYASSRDIGDISSISSDSLMLLAWNDTNSVIRIVNSGSFGPVAEAAKQIDLGHGFRYLVRLAVSLEQIEHLRNDALWRSVLSGIGVFIAAGFLISLLYFRRKHRDVQQSSELILSNITDAVVAIDSSKIIVVFNNAAEKIFNAPGAPMPGFETLFPNGHPVNNAIDKLHSLDMLEINCCDRDLALSLSYVNPAADSFDIAIIIIRDLTERKAMQRRLHIQDKQQAMGRMAGSVAHEIRNPLNAINVIAQRFQYEFSPDSDEDEYLELVSTVRSEVKRVNEIITQFLEFARPRELRREDIDITTIIHEVFKLFRDQASAQSINLQSSAGPKVLSIDRDKMKQVLINLVKNAIEAMPEGGNINISHEAGADTYSLFISDDGPGIDTKKMDRIFDLYYTDKAGGTGLGLSIVHHIMAEHNAIVKAWSLPGKGTKFTLTFPGN